MSLKLIAGPANSGRAGAILEGFRARLRRDPVLVVPTLDDSDRFEGELCEGLGGVVGGSVCTFAQLFEQVAGSVGASRPALLSRGQRVRVTREAAERAELTILARSRERAGFAPAAEALIDELQALGLEPEDFAERAAAAGEYERELARLFSAYASVRDELGRGDAHTLARSAVAGLRADGEAWGARPVFLYGFDDLTGEQLELVAELAVVTEVTVALSYEDRDAAAARARLREQLRELGAEEEPLREADPANTASALLFGLERRFLEEPGEPLEPDPALELLEAAGELAEVEAIGEAVARLLANGTAPDEIAIVLRQPAAQAPLYRRVLGELGIPVAVEARLPIGRTCSGHGLLALLGAAFEPGGAKDLLAYLRTPGIAHPRQVDGTELEVSRGRMRSADQVAEVWRRREPKGTDLRELDELRRAASGPELLRAAAYQARRIAERAMNERRGELPGPERALELRAGGGAERALGELADLGLPASPRDVAEAIEAVSVPLWRGPAAGRVRVLSPYRVRAGRVDHLFVASLQDGDFPRRPLPAPLLDDERRAELGLPERADEAEEERYLFSVCLSRPRKGLRLSWRSSDDEGRSLPRSAFVDQVRELFDGEPETGGELGTGGEAEAAEPRPSEAMLTRRGLGQVVPRPADAPSAAALGRALAALGPDGWPAALESLQLPDGLRADCRAALAEAEAKLGPERIAPGPLGLEPVLAQLRAREVFSPSGLETYATCAYMWFAEKELNPQDLEPQQETTAIGSIVHAVLERLYRDGAGGAKRPSAEAMGAWRERAWEIAREAAADEGLDPDDPEQAAQLRRAVGLALAFLEDEARAGMALVPQPELAEASFGLPGAEKPALELGGFAVHGTIDRVDLTPEGAGVRAALIQDYKSAREVAKGPAKLREDGKLQLQLYMRAIRELWGIELIGGVYRPLGGTNKRQAQGLLRKEMSGELDGLPLRPGDLLSDEDFELALDDAAEHAAEIVARMRAGRIRRDPTGGACPPWCSYQPICRRERGGEEEAEDEFGDAGAASGGGA